MSMVMRLRFSSGPALCVQRGKWFPTEQDGPESAQNARRGGRVCLAATPGAHQTVASARRARRRRADAVPVGGSPGDRVGGALSHSILVVVNTRQAFTAIPRLFPFRVEQPRNVPERCATQPGVI